MRKFSEFIHPTPNGGRCRIGIYIPDDVDRDQVVVLCTEPSSGFAEDNPGGSITNFAEVIAAELICYRSLPKEFIWIEHYEDPLRAVRHPRFDRATFDLVTFSDYEPRDVRVCGIWRKTIGEPDWLPLDRNTVEELIGRKI